MPRITELKIAYELNKYFDGEVDLDEVFGYTVGPVVRQLINIIETMEITLPVTVTAEDTSFTGWKELFQNFIDQNDLPITIDAVRIQKSSVNPGKRKFSCQFVGSSVDLYMLFQEVKKYVETRNRMGYDCSGYVLRGTMEEALQQLENGMARTIVFGLTDLGITEFP